MAKKKPKQKKTKPTAIKRKAKPHNGATSKHDMEERHEFVESLIGSGLRYRQTVRAIIDKYTVSRTTAERYIKAVYKKWDEEEAEERPLKKREAKEQVRETFMRALNDKQYGPAVRAVELLCKMNGVDPGALVKLEHSGEVHERHEVGETTVELIRLLMSDKKASNKFFEALKKKHASDRDKK